MITRLATADAVYERFTPPPKSVALKLRVYSEPESVVGMLICGTGVVARAPWRSMNEPSDRAVFRWAPRQVRRAFAASITLPPPMATMRSARQRWAARAASKAVVDRRG